MDDKEKKQENAATTKTNCDLRTFLIALLTSIIVIAIYHIGMTCCKYFCCEETCVSRQYMLVPVVNCMPQGPGPCMPGPGMRRQWKHHRMMDNPGCPGMKPGCPGMKPGCPGMKPGCPGMKPGCPGKPDEEFTEPAATDKPAAKPAAPDAAKAPVKK